MDPTLVSTASAAAVVGSAAFLLAALRNVRLAWQEHRRTVD